VEEAAADALTAVLNCNWLKGQTSPFGRSGLREGAYHGGAFSKHSACWMSPREHHRDQHGKALSSDVRRATPVGKPPPYRLGVSPRAERAAAAHPGSSPISYCHNAARLCQHSPRCYNSSTLLVQRTLGDLQNPASFALARPRSISAFKFS
jgi:hypothetical protein